MKKGFTLVELLAVLVIIGVLALVATPVVKDVIDNAKDSTNIRSTEKYIESAQLFITEGAANDNIQKYTNANIFHLLDIDNSRVTDGVVTFNKDRQVSVSLMIDDKCYVKTYDEDNDDITVSSSTDPCNSSTFKVTPSDACFQTDEEDGGIYITGYQCGDTATSATRSSKGVTVTYQNDGIANNIIIPSSINGLPVVGIDENAFSSCASNYSMLNQTNNVTMLANIVDKDIAAASSCTSYHNQNGIKSIVIPDSVLTIGDSAFLNNELTNVTIGNGVTNIGDSSFENNQLTNITIPNTVTSIGIYAFGENQITNVIIPNSVTSIANFAFFFNNLSTVTVGTGLTYIGQGAFLKYMDSNFGNSNPNLTKIYNNSSISNTSTIWNNAITGSETGDISSVSITKP